MRILDTCFNRDAPGESPGLEPFQARAHHHLRRILERRGGAILADSVGLGKTHVAVALIRDELATGGTILVTAPAQLRAHWMRHLRELVRCRWVSHTSLSRGARRVAPATLIVVDEAHAFRNPRTRRYAALAMLCADSRVLLLTATPVNNSLFDFYNLVRIFAARDLFADLGVADLLAAVESALRSDVSAELRRVADAVMVRRTRRAVMTSQSRNTAAAPPCAEPARRRAHAMAPSTRPRDRLRFPVSGPIETVRYDLSTAWPDLLVTVRDLIPSLVFPAHSVAEAAPRELMRLGLLKRLESSSWAFGASIRRHIRVLDHFIAAAGEGLLFDVRGDRADLDDGDGAVQLSLRSISLRPWPASLDRARHVRAAEHDLRALRGLAMLLPQAAASTERAGAGVIDPKFVRLAALVDGELADETVLLFTEYQETARGLWRSLAHRPGIALVHGGDARLGRGRSSRRAVIERFAPRANHVRPPRAVERVRLLIATDVLAEGLNLQDARVVISYDLPWNPVRLAQRIGRIDRLGSPHERIRALAFAPDRGVDELLGLMKRIRRKLRHIRIVGGDAPWSLADAKVGTRTIDEIDAAGEARERARAAWCDVAERSAAAPEGPVAHPDAEPCVGVLSWRHRHPGALCCFCTGDEVLLVLASDTRPAEVNTAACWSALADSLSAGGGPDERAQADDVGTAYVSAHLHTDARAAERRARSALRPRSGPAAAARPGPATAAAAATVMRWLADRPGGPSREEAERADGFLRRLRAGRRAGHDIRLEMALRSLDSSEELIGSLASGHDASGTGSDPVAPRPGPAREGAAPRLAAVLLFHPAGE